MARPKAGYRLQNGKRVPGVTTVYPKHDIEGLLYWAWNEGREGRNYRETRDDAATAGTLSHEMIESFVKKETFDTEGHPDDLVTLALSGFAAFKRWAEMTRLEIVATEMPLVSEEFKYGGTPDAIAMVDGQCCLLDFKTGRFYSEHLLQAAAYRNLWNENNPEDPVFEAHVLRVGKEHADFSHHFVTNKMLDICWEQFKDFRRTYERNKQIKKMVG